MTTVTGILRDAQQNAIPNAGVTVRYTRALVGFNGGAVAQNDRLFTTDGSGELVMPDLIPGHYEISVSMPVNANTSQAVIKRGTMSVLDDGPMALEDALDSNITVTPSVLLQAQAAAAAAETSEQNAGGFAAAASGSASAAGTSSANALSSAVAAGAQIYPSAAAGIAAVSVGDIFYVPLSPFGGLDIRQKTGASASTSIGQFLPPTQSPTDTTAGRLLKVGDFNIGATDRLPNFASDLNDYTIQGIFGYVSDAANRPPSIGPTFSNSVEVIRSGAAGRIFQISRQSAGSTDNGYEYHRVYDGTSWSPWWLSYSQRNVVGTVSQSGGVPTGAVIQRGSNANGEFVRFADGTQICSRTFSLPAPDIEFLSPSFPASFSAAPAVVLHACIPDRGSADRYANVAYADVSSSGISAIRVRRVTPNSDAAIVTYHAIGRWF